MKVIKIILLILLFSFILGCTKLEDLNYETIVNKLLPNNKKVNVSRNGYQIYIPKGIQIKDSGFNYLILEDKKLTYYLYIDMISYINKLDMDYNLDDISIYSRNLNYKDKIGCVKIKLIENNKYMIEIMYNYAKIEVIVDDSMHKTALINSLNIINSIKYDDVIIKKLLNQGNLNYNEESFQLFKEHKDNKDILEYNVNDEKDENGDLKDPDLIN